MKTINIIIWNLAILICLLSCEPKGNSIIKFVNKSGISVYINKSFEYPDTIVGTPAPTYWQKKVVSGETNTYALNLFDISWETQFRGKGIPSDTLMVFVFDANKLDSLYKESSSVDVFSTLLKRYDLSLQDLQQVNWVLTYPPSTEMKYIKMYPPYGN
ncbi:MAG: hypothetical protein LBN27_04180 [Prevotellaceae bacterium]|nr:hypothetical protein [Prevotellaceae bacterium]